MPETLFYTNCFENPTDRDRTTIRDASRRARGHTGGVHPVGAKGLEGEVDGGGQRQGGRLQGPGRAAEGSIHPSIRKYVLNRRDYAFFRINIHEIF